MKVFTVAEMVAAEKAADAAGHSYAQMMEIAGRRVAEAVAERLPVDGRAILILVGPGNNGGDGLVTGRYLTEMGAAVAFYLFKERNPAQDDNLARVLALGLPLSLADADSDWSELRRLTLTADIILDGLLGTGVARPIEGQLAALLRQVHACLSQRAAPLAEKMALTYVNRASLPDERPGRDARPTGWPHIVAIDCPSGLNCDSGALDPLALKAALTVTFAGPKWGHFLFPGAAACGLLVVADIDIDPALPEVSGVAVSLATKPAMRRLLPPRPLDGHKGRFGSAYIAAGSDYYRGAAILAGRAAYRVGAGLVALVTPTAVRPTAAAQLPEATYPPVPDKKRLGAKTAKRTS
jgi:ADP-dependent NAD(P)H-hydrate dehydratase / NAD(P)H-hydrate epimerase